MLSLGGFLKGWILFMLLVGTFLLEWQEYLTQWTRAENMKKGANDKPDVDVVIAESGELPVTETPEKTEGEKVPPKEDL